MSFLCLKLVGNTLSRQNALAKATAARARLRLHTTLASYILVNLLVAFNCAADTSLFFFSGADYGLNGDRPGDTSNLLLDPTSGLSGRITTRSITPDGGSLDIVNQLGIRSPSVGCDNCFDLGESWTFSWDVSVVFKGLQFARPILFSNELKMTLQCDAWKGLALTPDVNETFDAVSGTFTFHLPNAPFPQGFTLPAGLVIQPGTTITLMNLSQSPTAVDAMTFIIVPEPTSPIISCSPPLVLECTSGAAIGTIQAEVQDTNRYPLQVVWTVDGTTSQTNNIPVGGALTNSNLTFTASFGLGEHVVIVSVSNGHSDPATCSTKVTVRDTAPPQIVDIAATPNVLWPPNHRVIPVSLSVDAIDDCDPSPTVQITSVTSNEPQNPFVPDWEITGAQSLNLRAERLGTGQGRIYTIVVQCKDMSGNVSSASVVVQVPH